MNTKLFQITPQFNHFVDDQVLTSHQLNEFLEYFNEQDRLSRIFLNGVGIVCGFQVSLAQATSEITVNQGCAITTDGDLLKLVIDIDNPQAKLSKDTKTMDISNIVFSHYKPFDDDKAKYAHFKKGAGTINLLELVPKTIADPAEGHLNLNTLNLSDKVVLLYLENYLKTPDLCTESNCDNQGQTEVQKLKVLLVSKSEIEDDVNPKDPIYNTHNVYENYLKVYPLAMPKVVLDSSTGLSNNIQTFQKLATSYRKAITQIKTPMRANLEEIFLGFNSILKISATIRNNILNGVQQLDSFATNERVQYRYDVTKDLCETYNELYHLLLNLKTICCPPVTSFPKHVLLGSLQNNEPYSEMRHEFYPAPKSESIQDYVSEAQSLVLKIHILINRFSINMTGPVKITPSVADGVLSKKTIPFYYNVNQSFISQWDFNKTREYKQKFNLSYHTEHLANIPWVQQPLKSEDERVCLYRIEGHLGHNALNCRDTILSIRNENGLDFDCVVYDYATNFELFKNLIKHHPSISHKAGVKKGGTFILLANNDEILADFSIDYKIIATQNEQSCCYLTECSYPWISSLKYINNLSRALTGTFSISRPFAQEYTLQVLEYTINGHKLINIPTTIRIPMQQVHLRRIHAITDALNKRFDKGVVFDFNESQKRFLIIRAKEDHFTIRFRDLTHPVNNPVYTYSNNGMFRNNVIFRPDAMRCRDLKEYKPSFYEKLHLKIAPVNKDDDYGAFKQKWSDFNKLIEQLVFHPLFGNTPRFITTLTQFPLATRNEIFSIRNAIRTITPNAGIRIDGDWVNGSWVDNQMLNHFRANRNNSHDTVVKFIRLRDLLHSKTGVTKVSIYITNDPYDAKYDGIIEQFSTIADFYFGVPSGENVIII
jgi:hypothetical protein